MERCWGTCQVRAGRGGIKSTFLGGREWKVGAVRAGSGSSVRRGEAGEGQAGPGYQLATTQGFFLNSEEDATECGSLSWQAAGAGPETSGSGRVLKHMASARAHL